MWNPQSYTDTVLGKGIKSVGWHQKLLLKEERVGGLRYDKPPTAGGLASLGRCGAVSGAAALAFAIVLACVFAAALSFAIVLAFAGVLGCFRGRLVLSHQQYPGVGGCSYRGDATLLRGLRIQACRRTAEQTCKRSGEGESICGMVLHL
jgi:hypothetical protein